MRSGEVTPPQRRGDCAASAGAPLVLVIGAEGAARRCAVRAIRERTRFSVRTLSPTDGDPAAQKGSAAGCDVAVADVNDLDSLRNAMAGCYAVAVCLERAPDDTADALLHVRNLLDAAADTGIGHLVIALATRTARSRSADVPPRPEADPACERLPELQADGTADRPLPDIQAYARSLGVAIDVIGLDCTAPADVQSGSAAAPVALTAGAAAEAVAAVLEARIAAARPEMEGLNAGHPA